MTDTIKQTPAEKAKDIAEKVKAEKPEADIAVASEVMPTEQPQAQPEPTSEIQTTESKDLSLDQAKGLAIAVDTFIFGNSLTKKLAKEQIDLCKQTALLFGLNPLKREIHFIPRWNEKAKAYDVTTVVGYEVYIARAEDTGLLDGWEVTFEGQGNDMKAILTVYRKGWSKPFKHESYMVESKMPSPIWTQRPRFMLRKTVIGQGFRLCFPKQMGGLPYMPEELGVGVIENGQLSEERPAKAIAPAKITEKQVKYIHTLLDLKGKEKKAIHQYYMVASIADLTMEQASRAIAKLQTYPDLQPDTFEQTAEHIDVDEVAAGIEQQRLEEEGK